MSLFLGPVHHLMHKRILYLDSQSEVLLNMGNRSGWVTPKEMFALDQLYPPMSEEPLENIIDTSNIHGWLASAVESAELRYAQTVRLLMDKNPEALPEMKETLEAFGRETAFDKLENAKEAFELLQDRLLDGMPCDFPFKVEQEGSKIVTWRLRVCPHTKYFEKLELPPALFYELRSALIKGLLFKSPDLQYLADGGSQFEIKKG